MTARDIRIATHYRDDGCPGGHPELLPAPGVDPATPVDLDGLVADLITALHGWHDDLRQERWAARAVAASDLLHQAGYHTGRMTRTDWRACPTCHMHPERHVDGAG